MVKHALVEGCAEHNIPLIDGRCPKCRDANGNTFILDMQSKVLLPASQIKTKTQLSDIERGIVAMVSSARFVPGTPAKRFILDLEAGRIKELTDRQRWYLAFCAHRFRRQYTLTPEQWQWVNAELKRAHQMSIGELAKPS